MSVLFESSLGVFVIDLYLSERSRLSFNFLKLCKSKIYHGCLFHSVQKNLVAQTGDPTGTGDGGFSFEWLIQSKKHENKRYIDAERVPKINHTKRGLVSMVDNGYGQHGSQFFITLSDDLDYLNKKHTIIGYIAEGIDVIDSINEVYCDKNHRPYRNIRLNHVIVLDDPFPDPVGMDYPSSPTSYPILDLPGSPRIEEDEELDDEPAELSPRQIAEDKAEQEARTNAQLLTLVGDLPDVDVKPPDNVLFVCRLNPVTTSEDLNIIFSRFGEIKSCEVVQDKRTGASLQYAFIEFEEEKDCTEAYFKMDKVVIDDRRIHVDFSQSVAKMHPKSNSMNFKRHIVDRPEEYSTKDRSKRVRSRSPVTSSSSSDEKEQSNYYRQPHDEFDVIVTDNDSDRDSLEEQKSRSSHKQHHKSQKHHHKRR